MAGQWIAFVSCRGAAMLRACMYEKNRTPWYAKCLHLLCATFIAVLLFYAPRCLERCL